MPKDQEDLESEIMSEADIHSFVVRAWREEPASKEYREIWRGHVTPIPNGERVYFKSIDEIPEVIRTLLKRGQ